MSWARYEIRLTSPSFTSEDAEKLTTLYTNPLVVMKRSKAAMRSVVSACRCISVCARAFAVSPSQRFKPRKANELMREYKISFIVGVPNMYRKMFEQKNFEGKHLRNLELLFSGGDISETEQFLDMFQLDYSQMGSGKGRLFRGYGLTEVSSVCCANTYADFKRNSVGKPFYGMRVEIWDKDKKRLPANTVGEIAVSGSTLMEGYLKRADKQEVYTDDSGVRWVLTGDLGYIDEDGFLFFAGRKKRLIVISGLQRLSVRYRGKGHRRRRDNRGLRRSGLYRGEADSQALCRARQRAGEQEEKD